MREIIGLRLTIYRELAIFYFIDPVISVESFKYFFVPMTDREIYTDLVLWVHLDRHIHIPFVLKYCLRALVLRPRTRISTLYLLHRSKKTTIYHLHLACPCHTMYYVLNCQQHESFRKVQLSSTNCHILLRFWERNLHFLENKWELYFTIQYG